jgi:Family of unknown function (DUF6118)
MEPLTMTDTLAPAPEEAGSDDAAQAFEALRAANTAGFQGVAEQLKALVAGQAELAKSPALRQTPKQIADDQVKQRAEMLDRVQNEWREPTRHANAEWNGLVKLTKGMRARSAQNWWIGGACLAGLLLWPILITSLNTSASSRLVTWTLGYADRWAAGNHLMREGNPEQMRNWLAAAALWNANLDAINACTLVPVTPGKKRVCALVLQD